MDLLTVSITFLLIDSLVVIYAAAKQKWVLFAIAIVIGGLLDLLILHLRNATGG